MIEHDLLRRLVSVRYLFQLAADQSDLSSEAASFASISMLHDSIEAFLHTAATHYRLKSQSRTDVIWYFDAIDQELGDESKLPHRTAITQINKSRVNAKHDGVKPDHTELVSFVAKSRNFLEDSCRLVFGMDFWSLSLVDSLSECESKTLLAEAEAAAKESDFAACLVNCRRAIFVEFESDYDISPFKYSPDNFFLTFGCHAPAYSKSLEYINEYVKDPFDFIVVDYSGLDSNLAKMRIDHVTWWNITRLTPQVYRRSREAEWITKQDQTLTAEGIQNRAAYVLDSTIEVVRKKQIWQKSLRFSGSNDSWILKPNVGAKIYSKADKDSEVVAVVPNELKSVIVRYGTIGLDDEQHYWSIFSFDESVKYLSGYLLESDVDRGES